MPYDKLNRSYDALMRRDREADPTVPNKGEASEAMSLGMVQENQTATRRLQGGEEVTDIKISSYIQSTNFKPWLTGFKIDGHSGAAQFNHVFVASRNPWPGIDIEKLSGTGTGLFIRSNAGVSLEIEQQSNTAGISVKSLNLSGGLGTITAENDAGDGTVLNLTQKGTGVVAYFERELPEVGETHFYPILLYSGGNFTNLIKIWVSDGANPNGDLLGAIGDICHDKAGKLWVCKGGFVWNDASSSGGIFGNGLDGDATVNADVTLGSDMFFDNLTVNVGKRVNLGGYSLYVRNVLTNNGFISNNGGNATNGQDATGGNRGQGGLRGSYSLGNTYNRGQFCSVLQAGNGGQGIGLLPTAGSDGEDTATALSNATGGAGGGPGGYGGNSAGSTTPPQANASGGSQGFVTGYALASRLGVLSLAQTMSDLGYDNRFLSWSAGSGSGGGGGRGGYDSGVAGAGGGGGGAGGGAGFAKIFANILVNNGSIECKGGNGGNGGKGGDASGGEACGGGGGGGGGGGVGGCVVLAYTNKSGVGTIDVTGGAKGIGGAGGSGISGGGPGVAGQDGEAGPDGASVEFQV